LTEFRTRKLRLTILTTVLVVCGVLGALAAMAIRGTSANAARGIATTTVSGTLPVGLPAVDTQFKMSTADAQNFSEFALFSPGNSVDGTSETEILRMIQSPSPTESALGVDTWMNMVDFIYGSCSSANASDEQTCSPPIEIQNWPACDRNLSLYPPSGSLGLSYYTTTINGAAAAVFDEGDNGGRVEVYTGGVSVVIFAESTGQALAIASELQPINALARSLAITTAPGGKATALAPPAPGATAGGLQCPSGVNAP
jgi:hypothetical protein